MVVAGVTDSLPLVAGAPLQPPEAAQVSALVATQESVAPLPATTDCEEAVSVTSGFMIGASDPAPEQPASSREMPHRLRANLLAAGIPGFRKRRIDPRA